MEPSELSHFSERAWPWRFILPGLVAALFLGAGLSAFSGAREAERRDRLNHQLTPLTDNVAALDTAMTGMDAALRGLVATGDDRQLDSYHIAERHLAQAVEAALPLADRLGGRLPAQLDRAAAAAVAWQHDGAEPEIAARGAASVAGAPAVRATALFTAYSTTYSPLAGNLDRSGRAARDDLQSAEGLHVFALGGTFTVLALVLMLLAMVAGQELQRRQRLAAVATAAVPPAPTPIASPPMLVFANQWLLNGLRDAVFAIDLETLQIREANLAAQNLSGYSRAQLLALTPNELRGGRTPQGLPAAVAAMLSAGAATTAYRFAWTQRDGARIPLEGVNSVAQPEGKPVLVAILRDLRTRPQEEQAESETRDQLEVIREGVADGIVVQDAHGTVTYANETSARILGYASATELIGGTLEQPARGFEVLDEAGIPLAPEQMPLRRVLRGEAEAETLLRYRSRTSDEERWIVCRSFGVQGEDGRARLALTILHDLTDLIRAQEDLRRSRDQLDAILQGVADGITVSDPLGFMVYANDAAARILDFASQDAMLAAGADPWKAFDLTDESGRPIAPAALPGARALQGEHAAEMLVRAFARKGSKERWLIFKSTPIVDDLGRVRYAVNVLQDITQRRRAEHLERQALTDALTGLPNRRLAADRLQQAILTGKRNNASFSLLFLDLNRFKHVNDTYGHHTGDLLLQETAKRLQALLRQSDTVARLGGDEFTVILQGTRRDGAIVAAEKIVETIERPYELGGVHLEISSSIGISAFPDDGTDSATLTQRADTAMYYAKRTGAGYALYSREMDNDEPPIEPIAIRPVS